MTAGNIIQAAMNAGIHLATRNGQIELTAKERPNAQILELLRNHRGEVIDELERLQSQWLARVAFTLNTTPDHLLDAGIVEEVDLLEQWHTEPRHAVALVRSWYRPDQCQTKQAVKND